MHQHLTAKGLSKTAEVLVQEANLNIPEKKSLPFTYVSHCRVSIILKTIFDPNKLITNVHIFVLKNRSLGGGMSPLISRHSVQNQKSESLGPSNGLLNTSSNVRVLNTSSPIRLNVNRLIFCLLTI